MENVCASQVGRERNVILDTKSVKYPIVAAMDIAKTANVSA